MKIDDGQSAKFANMSVVCAFMVVCMHIGGTFQHGSAGWWVTEITRDGVSRIAVPYFFLAAGFFLAGHVDEQGWWRREVLKRVKTLLVPLVIWCVIGTVWDALWTACANHLVHRPLVEGIPFFKGEWLPGVGILWFVRNLFFLVVVSPAIAFVIRRAGWIAVAFSFIVYWSVFTCLDPVAPQMAWQGWVVYMFSLEGLAYFTTGMFLRISGMSLLHCRSVANTTLLLFCGTLLLACSLLFNFKADAIDAWPLMNFRHFCIPFLMISLWRFMPTTPIPYLLGVASPVYVLHGLVAVPVNIVFKRMSVYGAMGYLSRWIVVFFVCVMVAKAIHRFLPRSARMLFGGR